VPKRYSFTAQAIAQGIDHVLVAIGSREGDNAKFHAAKVANERAFLSPNLC
jgi:coenzyme F420-reducing hydrogenase delta subunit